jgi:hypothetical protein
MMLAKHRRIGLFVTASGTDPQFQGECHETSPLRMATAFLWNA